jgi:hypothetical protein
MLPPELWLEIFQLVAPKTTAFSASLKSPIDPKNRKPHTESLHNAEQPMKLSLSLVCKDWRSVAPELLFDVVIIDTRKLWILSLDALQPSQNRPNPCRFVRVLEISVQPRPFGIPLNLLMSRINTLLGYCTNVHVFLCHSRPRHPFPPLDNLFANAEHSLQYLSLDSVELPPDFLDQLERVSSGLKYLKIRDSGARQPFPDASELAPMICM